jgi:hypothetical protein
MKNTIDAEILKHLPTFSDPAENYEPGSPEWSARVTLRTYHAIGYIHDRGTRQLIKTLRYVLPHEPWLTFPQEHPLCDVDSYFSALCGLAWKDLVTMVRGIDPDAARELEVIHARTQAKYVRAGKPTTDENHAGGMNLKQGSNNTTYLLRRLARENKDILDAYQRGEYLSVTAAARAAGLKPEPPLPLDQIKRLIKKLSDEEKAELKQYLDRL